MYLYYLDIDDDVTPCKNIPTLAENLITVYMYFRFIFYGKLFYVHVF